MVKDTKANKEADKKLGKRRYRNQADSLIFSTEDLKEHGDKISEEEKKLLKMGYRFRNALKERMRN